MGQAEGQNIASQTIGLLASVPLEYNRKPRVANRASSKALAVTGGGFLRHVTKNSSPRSLAHAGLS